MIDKLPAWAQHLVIAVVPVLLAWLSSDIIPQLSGRVGWAGIAGVVLSVIVAVVTPITRSYGIGKPANDSDQVG